MKLKSLSINKKWSGDGFTGSVCFSNDRGDVKLKLQEDHLAPIVDIMADAIVSQARCVADELAADAINSEFKVERIIRNEKRQEDKIEQLLRQVSKRDKVINYCINQIQDSSKLKYIGTITKDMDT